MRPVPRIPGLVLPLLLALAFAATDAGAICPDDWRQCLKPRVAQEITFHVNPAGVVTLDFLNATVDANRTFLAPPGSPGNVTVELLHAPDEENATANVTITVASASVNWTSDLSRSVTNLTGFHNETFTFAVGAALGNASIFVNVTSGGVQAPMELRFRVGAPPASPPSPPAPPSPPPPVVVPPVLTPPSGGGPTPGVPEVAVLAILGLAGLALARRR